MITLGNEFRIGKDIKDYEDLEDVFDLVEYDEIDEAYAEIPLMTVRNQLMKKLGDDYKAIGGSMNPKVLISYVDDPKLEFEITPDGKNVAIMTKYDKVPDTLHKKRGIALMRASNILYDYITQTTDEYEKGLSEGFKLRIREND